MWHHVRLATVVYEIIKASQNIQKWKWAAFCRDCCYVRWRCGDWRVEGAVDCQGRADEAQLQLIQNQGGYLRHWCGSSGCCGNCWWRHCSPVTCWWFTLTLTGFFHLLCGWVFVCTWIVDSFQPPSVDCFLFFFFVLWRHFLGGGVCFGQPPVERFLFNCCLRVQFSSLTPSCSWSCVCSWILSKPELDRWENQHVLFKVQMWRPCCHFFFSPKVR